MAEEQEQDFSKLSIEERCNHKNWKARVSGYESLAQQFQVCDDDKEFVKYAPLMKKFVVDTNAAAQEKGLASVLAFVENYSNAGKYVEGVIGGIITKCLISPKVKTRELAAEIVLMFVEIEKQELVIEELIKGLDNKTPKIVAASVSLIRQCLNNYGVKVINIKAIVKIIPRLFDDRDKNIRDEGKQLAVELFRWIKDALKPQLQNLKAVQLQELETEFDKVKDERPRQTRLLRSQQAKVEQEVAIDQIDGNSVSAIAAPQEEIIDPYDLLEPVDILAKIPNDFYEMCESKKWQERKESLEKVQELIEKNPRLVSGDYSDLVRLLKRMVGKDTNIIVVTIATKCLGGLATALRKSFHSYANSCIQVIIEKFKEKKQTVVLSLREAIDAIIVATTIEAIIEDITNALVNKNPQIKSETSLFLVRTFAKTHPNVLNKKLLKTLTTSLITTLSDMDATVRDSAAEALGTAMKVVGEKTMTPFLQGVEAIKMTKIKEFHDKAEVKITAASVPTAPPPTKPPAVKRPPKANIAKAPSQESLGSNASEDIAVNAKTISKKPMTKPTAKVVPKPTLGRPQTNGSSSNLTQNSDETSSQSNSSTTTRRKFLSKNKTSKPPTVATKTSKKTDDLDTNTPLLPLNKMKDQRLADEKALKVLKWNFTAPREEFYTQLKEQMINAEWQTNLINYSFHYDFKFHIKAIDLMREFLIAGNFEATLANCDLILKWIAIRFFDTNPSVILKALEYVYLIFESFHANSEGLTDSDANSFLPYLVLKSGDPKDAVRNKVREIFKKLSEIYSPSKLFTHLMTGLQSKNARQRMTCLEDLANLIESFGLSVCQTTISITMKEIAKFIADRDNGVRNAALNCVVQVYFIEGEKVYKHVGQLTDKDSSLLEERIKRASKTRLPLVPPATAPPAVNTVTKMTSAPNIMPERQPEVRTPSPPHYNTATITKHFSSAKSASRQRPKSMGVLSIGPLSLDLEEIEQTVGNNLKKKTPPRNIGLTYRAKDMYNEENLEEMLNLPDIQIRKSMSSMNKLINSSPKAEVALNLVMAQLSSQEISSAMEALSQLSQLLSNDAKAEPVLSTKVDQLIIMCYMQYRLFLTKHLADQSIEKTQAVELFKGVTDILLTLFSKSYLGPKASRDVLRELMSHLIQLLVDPKLNELNENKEIVRSVNILVSNVISGSDSTSIMTALIKILYDCVGNSINASAKFIDMIMKCLWKMCRNLDKYINTLDIDKVLLEVHLFLKSFPSIWWKDNNKMDTPLRTIKTLTYLIVDQKGEMIFSHLALIQDKDASELCHYLQKALKQRDKLSTKTPTKTDHHLSPKDQKLSKSAQNHLMTILSKIGTDENQSGITELYEFTQTNPQISLEPYLQKSSDFFKKFISDELNKIRSEKQAGDIKIESNGKHSDIIINGEERPKRTAFSRVPPPTNQKEALDWLRKATTAITSDPKKFKEEDILTQMNSNDAINSIEAAELAIQRAQERLESFKKVYGQKR
ncbi:protein mini spindles-like [Oppia nitens]|uniref:protein mini spindles-like n=1 Tax=Oppia nitens TaxID=1686743 RepID=UPI0023DB3B1B|nr:protein mini spindles-like [Oppia nitens]